MNDRRDPLSARRGVGGDGRGRGGREGSTGPRGTRALLRGGWAPSGRAAPAGTWLERVHSTPRAHPARARRLPVRPREPRHEFGAGTIGGEGVVIEALGAERCDEASGGADQAARRARSTAGASAEGALDPSAVYCRLLTEGGQP